MGQGAMGPLPASVWACAAEGSQCSTCKASCESSDCRLRLAPDPLSFDAFGPGAEDTVLFSPCSKACGVRVPCAALKPEAIRVCAEPPGVEVDSEVDHCSLEAWLQAEVITARSSGIAAEALRAARGAFTEGPEDKPLLMAPVPMEGVHKAQETLDKVRLSAAAAAVAATNTAMVPANEATVAVLTQRQQQVEVAAAEKEEETAQDSSPPRCLPERPVEDGSPPFFTPPPLPKGGSGPTEDGSPPRCTPLPLPKGENSPAEDRGGGNGAPRPLAPTEAYGYSLYHISAALSEGSQEELSSARCSGTKERSSPEAASHTSSPQRRQRTSPRRQTSLQRPWPQRDPPPQNSRRACTSQPPGTWSKQAKAERSGSRREGGGQQAPRAQEGSQGHRAQELMLW